MTRPLLAIQQIQLGTVTGSLRQVRETLRTLVAAGYECIELNGFMTRPTPPLVRLLTRVAGMPAGRGGRFDWPALVDEAGLPVVALHEDLGAIEREPDALAERAQRFRTEHIVVTGMYRFDYSDEGAVNGLARRLNQAGARLAGAGLRLLYHNHNAELVRLSRGRTAYDLLIEATEPGVVDFEFDAYWPTAAGADALALMRQLGERMVLLHLTDRGFRKRGPYLTPILKPDSVELGTGTMNLPAMLVQARAAGTRAVIVETHRNWIEGSPLDSAQRSAAFLQTHLPEGDQ